jgi:hypothetical protein
MKLVAATIALVVLAGLGSTRATSAPELVTLNVGAYRNANGILVLVFSGTVSGNASGQEVDVLGQDCGVRGNRLISGTHTLAGGGWRVENPHPDPPWRFTPWNSGMTFRARWNGELSAPRVYQLPAPVTVVKLPKRRWRVSVSPPPPGTVSMKGKVVELQRLRGGSWVRIARSRLVYKARLDYGGAFNHEAVFQVPQRGWRLRAFLPAGSAAPCYAAGASAEWRS